MGKLLRRKKLCFLPLPKEHLSHLGKYLKFVNVEELDIVVYTCNSRTQEAEAGRLKIPGDGKFQEMDRETLSQNKINKTKP